MRYVTTSRLPRRAPDYTRERFLFTGDASWLRRGWREHKHKGRKTRLLDNSRHGVMPMLDRIDALEKLAPEVKIVPAHDPEVWAELKHAPYWYGEPTPSP